MNVSYDRETDSLTITLRHDRISESDEITPNVIADFSKDGEVVSLEILSASQVIDDVDQVTDEKMTPRPGPRPCAPGGQPL